MFTLPLTAPEVSEMLAVHYLDRAAGDGLYRSAQWNSAWQGFRGGTGDILAWVLVAFFLLTLGVIAGCIIALRSRPAQLTPEQQLIEEVQRDEDELAYGTPTPATGPGSSPGTGDGKGDPGSDPWERDPDWWRKDN